MSSKSKPKSKSHRESKEQVVTKMKTANPRVDLYWRQRKEFTKICRAIMRMGQWTSDLREEPGRYVKAAAGGNRCTDRLLKQSQKLKYLGPATLPGSSSERKVKDVISDAVEEFRSARKKASKVKDKDERYAELLSAFEVAVRKLQILRRALAPRFGQLAGAVVADLEKDKDKILSTYPTLFYSAVADYSRNFRDTSADPDQQLLNTVVSGGSNATQSILREWKEVANWNSFHPHQHYPGIISKPPATERSPSIDTRASSTKASIQKYVSDHAKYKSEDSDSQCSYLEPFSSWDKLKEREH